MATIAPQALPVPFTSAATRSIVGVVNLLRKIPVTGAVIAVITAAAFIKAAVFSNIAAGTGLDSLYMQHNWVAAGTSVFLVEKPVYLAGVVLATLGLLGVAERYLGSLRALVSFVTVTVLGIAAGTALQGLGILLDNPAAEATRGQHMSDPLIPVLGTFLASTAYMRPVIARRVRVLSFALLLVFVLYSGQPSDTYRLTAAAAGLMLGYLLSKRRPRLHLRQISFTDARTLLAAIVAVTAIGPIVSVMAPARVGLFEPLGALFRDAASTTTPTQATTDSAGALLVTVLPLALQLIAAFAIFRGQRLGLWLAISINLALSAMAAVYFGTAQNLTVPNTALSGAADDTVLSVLVAIGVPAAVAVAAFGCIRFFPPNASHAPVHRFLVAAGSALAIASAIHLIAGAAGSSPAAFSELLAVLPSRLVPEGFFSFEPAAEIPVDLVGRILYDWLGAGFWLSIVVLALAGTLRRSPTVASSPSPETRAYLKRGLGAGPLAWMTTWPGHLYWHAPDNAGVIAYRIVNGVAVTTGEPLCQPTDATTVIKEFVTFCEDRGWIPVFYGVSETLRAQLAKEDWYSLKVAEETFLRTATWSLSGKKMQNIRTSLTKADKSGLRCEWTTYDALTSGQRDQLAEISKEWVADKKLPEMGFTLGGITELQDPDVSLMIATTESGKIDAVTSWLPTFHDEAIVSLTLDFMRRRSDSMPGVMDVVIAATMAQAKQSGIETVSLSAAPLADTKTGPHAGTAWLSRILEPAYGFQSLHRYKSKFQPEIQPLFLVYRNPFDLPAVGIGLAKAYVPKISIRGVVHLLAPSR